jgi:hypothetical protein
LDVLRAVAEDVLRGEAGFEIRIKAVLAVAEIDEVLSRSANSAPCSSAKRRARCGVR